MGGSSTIPHHGQTSVFPGRKRYGPFLAFLSCVYAFQVVGSREVCHSWPSCCYRWQALWKSVQISPESQSEGKKTGERRRKNYFLASQASLSHVLSPCQLRPFVWECLIYAWQLTTQKMQWSQAASTGNRKRDLHTWKLAGTGGSLRNGGSVLTIVWTPRCWFSRLS